MKGIYIARVRNYEEVNLGVIKKCLGQQEAFINFGIEVDLIWWGEFGIYRNDELIKEIDLTQYGSKVYLLYNYMYKFYKALDEFIDFNYIDFIYMRYELSHPLLVRFLKKAKKHNKNLIIFIEIPTYPYRREFENLEKKLLLLLDVLFRGKLFKYVDRIVHFGALKFIYSTPTIIIGNGISNKIEKIAKPCLDVNSLNLIAVGNWNNWHGLDRLISGIFNYYNEGYGSCMVKLKIVGGGESLREYRKQVKNLKLENYVQFTGPLAEKELDEVFDEMDMGIGNLALHRTGLDLAFPLKHREYCMRGLPFVLSTHDPDFNKDLDFVFYLECNDLPVNIHELILIKKRFSKDISHRSLIQNFALNNLTWSKKFEPVFNELVKLQY